MSMPVSFYFSHQIIEQCWNKLASKLKKHLTDELSQLPLAPPGGRCSNFCLDRRLELVDSLRVLCSDDSVWHKYKAIRVQQLEDIFAKLMPEVSHVSGGWGEEGCFLVDFILKEIYAVPIFQIKWKNKTLYHAIATHAGTTLSLIHI